MKIRQSMNTLRSAYLLLLVLAIFLVVAVGCQTSEFVPVEYSPNTSHQNYVDSLVGHKLSNTFMGSQWIRAGNPQMNPTGLSLQPFYEERIFDRSLPDAAYYLFEGLVGQRITISIDSNSIDGDSGDGNTSAGYFADLFGLDSEFYPGGNFLDTWSNNEFQAVAAARSLVLPASREQIDDSPILVGDSEIAFEPRIQRFYLLRIQPQLLEEGRFTVTVNSDPLLSWPVENSSIEDVISFFGAPRDLGARVHHGIDIIAPRGTPLLATDDLYISRIQTRERGGKTVFLEDRNRKFVYYYAHLDQWDEDIELGQFLPQGTVVGTVGNTGNAVNSPPHLHFGIYQRSWRGPLDPWYFWVDVGDLENTSEDPGSSQSELVANLFSAENLEVFSQYEANSNLRISPAVSDRNGEILEDSDKPILSVVWGDARIFDPKDLTFIAVRPGALAFMDHSRRTWWYPISES